MDAFANSYEKFFTQWKETRKFPFLCQNDSYIWDIIRKINNNKKILNYV